MIVTFSFEHGTRLTQADVDALTPHIRGDNGRVVEVTKEEDKYPWHFDYTGNIRAVMEACPHLINKIHLKGAELAPRAWEQVMERLHDIEKKIGQPGPAERSYNERVQVQVAGLGLLIMQHVMVRENCCTDDLQSYLDRGWRILAVCPQPDQRRPDYILGRATPEE